MKRLKQRQCTCIKPKPDLIMATIENIAKAQAGLIEFNIVHVLTKEEVENLLKK